MAHLTFRLNGVVRDAFVRYRTARIDKRGARESARIEFLDHDISASAMRPLIGDELHVHRGVSLEYGGEITRVTDRRLDEGMGGGTVTVVESRGWYFEAADVRIPSVSFPSQTLQESVEYLRARYLAAKGWINLATVPGGPVLRALTFQNRTVQEIFDVLQEESGYPWRVNGDRWLKFERVGDLVAPHIYDETNSIVLRGMTWVQDSVRRATRFFVTTGGQRQYVAHSETRYGDGTLTTFPVNVLPPERPAAVNNASGYAVGATSMAVDGLPPSAALKTGNVFRFATHHPYTLTGDVTTDGNGACTIAFTPALTVAVADNEALTFAAGVFVTLTVGGVPTAVLGAPWSFDGEQAQHVTVSTPPAPGVPVVYGVLIDFPATVRSWDASAQLATGAFDYDEIRDQPLAWPEETDVGVTHQRALRELANAVEQPKEISLRTFAQDVYPFMLATVDFPTRLLSGDYLIQDVILTDVGRGDTPQVELVMLEGSRIGRDWRAYWMGKDRRPAYVLPTDETPLMQWSTTAEVTEPAGAAGATVTPNAVAWSYSAWSTIVASLGDDYVLTAIHFTPANFGTHIELEIGVGAAGLETVIAAVPLYCYGGDGIAGASGECTIRFAIPIDALPTGQRVAARMRKSHASVFPWTVSISMMRKPLAGNLQTTTTRTHVTSPGAAGVSVAVSTTAWAFGAWTEIVAATSAAWVIEGATLGQGQSGGGGTAEQEWQIGTGAVGAETVLTTLRTYPAGTADMPMYFHLRNPLAGIASGARVAARVRKSGTHATALPIKLCYRELPL